MRSYLYLSTAVAGVVIASGAGTSFAQCVTTQNCAELGYTETSCPDGTGLKCPFGDTFACTGGSSEITPEQCTQLGFTHTCTGTNETGGGELCNNKYAFCSCADGYEWSNGSCNKIISPVACSIGTLYYSDGKCYNQKVDSKTLLGVVIYEKTDTENGWIMSITPLERQNWDSILYTSQFKDIPDLPNYTSTPNDIQASCTNTDTITAYGNSSRYQAAWAAKNYKPNGTPSGKNWCLPSGGLLSHLANSSNFVKVNAGITAAGGTTLGNVDEVTGICCDEATYSSSEKAISEVWILSMNTTWNYGKIYYGEKYTFATVRPVMAF